MPNQTHRVLEIIKRFNSGQKVCIEALQNEAMWEGKSDKTVRRDLDIIKAMFPDSFHLIRGEIGCYKAITHSLFSNIATASHLALFGIICLYLDYTRVGKTHQIAQTTINGFL
ncbi:MAG: hypothetical protein KU38_12760 [Sulfurovum sp. FS08-3]|nr:MAG: hypothetical protein KU38_12760 [Sulfurovum sp. FS08-3]